MIYLRPSRRIKNTESAGNIVISESLLDEHLSHIAYFVGDKRPFTLRIEASNGVVLDEHSTTATELSVRIYTREGVDVTEFVGSLKPSWQIGSEEIGKGLSYTVQASTLKNWHTKIIVTTTAARILDAMGKLQSKSPEEQRLLERLTIDASIEVRRDFVLLQRIPTAELVRDSLKLDREFIAATTGKPGAAGAPGKDADPVRPNLLTGFMGVEKKTLSAMGTNNTHAKLGISRYLEAGKMYAISADVEMMEGSANAITLVLWSGSDILAEGKTAINGTKTRASLIFNVPVGANLEDIDILGYAGERRKTSGNLAKYYNIKLEEVSSDTDKASAYIPHTDDLKGEPGKSVTLADLNIDWNGTKLVIAGKESQSLLGPAGPAGVQGIRGPQGIQGPKGAEGKPGAKGEPGKSPSPKEVADTINTAAWQNQIASAAASNILKTPTLSNELRELVQPDTTELIKRLSSRTMRQDILSQNGGKYLINVPAFALFEPEVEDGAAISLQVSIRQPIGSCTNPNNHDERGYFFIVKSWEPIYTTSAEKLCNKGGEIKVYYDSEQCAESLLSIKLERSNDHWVFVNYYDFAASIQADCTQIATQSHYSNKSQDEMLSYAPLQYLSGTKRNAVLPAGRVGLVIRVWANKWVGDVRVYTEVGESLYNTSHSSGDNVGREGVLIPAGHIGEFICINEEKIWLFTDLSR